MIVVEHRDRWARFGVEDLQAALAAQGRGIVMAVAGESTDDVLGDMVEVLTSISTRQYKRRGGARSRTMRAVTAAKQPDPVEAMG